MRALATSLLSFALAACASDGPTPPARLESGRPTLSRESEAPGPRSISGHCETRFTAPPLPPPLVFRQTDTGACVISSLGRLELVSVQDINFAAGTQTGTRTFTAANGDKLYATNVGTSAPTAPGRIGFEATLTFTGGTGHFEHAAGHASVRGEANMATRTASFAIDGWISFDGPDREDQAGS